MTNHFFDFVEVNSPNQLFPIPFKFFNLSKPIILASFDQFNLFIEIIIFKTIISLFQNPLIVSIIDFFLSAIISTLSP